MMTEAVAGSNENFHKTTSFAKMTRKNIKEQKFVEDEIMGYVHDVGHKFSVKETKRILKLGYIQHIKSTFQAVMKKFYYSYELLDLFHPTSAVCGIPKRQAQKTLVKLEKFPRGFYAAPCGFFSALEAEFAVGIRSLLIQNQKIYLFSGAGIIEDSIAEQEWQELNQKLQPFKEFFDLDL